MRIISIAFFLLILGCATRERNPYDVYPKEYDERLYEVTQSLLLRLDKQQAETLSALKHCVTVKNIPCLEQRYAPMYSEGYMTGYAYFSLTKNWLIYWGGIEVATPKNAYLVGWYEGQMHALSGKPFFCIPTQLEDP